MTPVRRRLGGPAVLAALLLVAACSPATPTASPATVTPTAAPTAPPSPPATPTPSPSRTASDPNAALYDRIEQQVIALRGLPKKAPVEREVLDEAGFREHVTSSFDEDNPPSLVAATEKLYKSLLLLPPTASLQDLYIDLLTSQVAGEYDQKTKKMYVVSRSGSIGPLEEVIYAHEFTHALQDQSFDLTAMVGEEQDQTDRTAARLTQIEGDAYLTMALWAQANLTAAELGQVAGLTDPAAEAALNALPDIVKQPLLFPATRGLSLALGDYTRGGFSAIDQRFANPPDSTEQILHPDKLASGEKPVPVTLPADLVTRMGTGWTVALEDTMGEAQLEILLRDGGGAESTVSAAAAAGWGGDRVALVEGPDDATGVVLDTVWDTDGDASEFAAALDGLVTNLTAAGRASTVLTPAPDRVVLVTAESEATMGKLANALGLAG